MTAILAYFGPFFALVPVGAVLVLVGIALHAGRRAWLATRRIEVLMGRSSAPWEVEGD